VALFHCDLHSNLYQLQTIAKGLANLVAYELSCATLCYYFEKSSDCGKININGVVWHSK